MPLGPAPITATRFGMITGESACKIAKVFYKSFTHVTLHVAQKCVQSLNHRLPLAPRRPFQTATRPHLHVHTIARACVRVGVCCVVVRVCSDIMCSESIALTHTNQAPDEGEQWCK